jgi:predicted permease
LLGLAGAVPAFVLASSSINALLSLSPRDLPRAGEIKLDGPVLAFTLAVSLLTSLVFGLVPALRASKTDLTLALKDGGRGVTDSRGGRGLRRGLVIAEIAAAQVLLIGAGLLLNSFWRLSRVSAGFNPDNVLTFRMSLPYNKYKNEQQVGDFYKQLKARLQTVPGIRSVSTVYPLPMSGENSPPFDFQIEGRQMAANERPSCDGRSVQPDYFATLGIRIIDGRDFNERDDDKGVPVALINKTLAKNFFQNEDPIGRRIRLILPMDETSLPMREIVGVVDDVKQRHLSEETRPEVYVPFAQGPFNEMYLAVKTEASPRTILSEVRGTVETLDKDQPIYDIKTLDQRLGASLAQQRFSAVLLALFAGVALILTAVGLYGVISYSVAQRTHEIGTRMALGARQQSVLALVMGDGLKLAVTGVIIGLGASYVLKQMIESLLFGVKATDPVTFAGIAALLTAVSLFATYVPARRAARVDPVIALRCE